MMKGSWANKISLGVFDQISSLGLETIMYLSKSCPTYPLPGMDRGLDGG